jgi:hypothetical protein
MESNIANKANIKAGRDVNIAGRDVIHNHPKEKEKLLLQPRGPDNAILETAERYWNFITQKKRNIIIYFILPLIISLLAGQDYFFTKIFSNIYLTSAGIAVVIALISVLIMRLSNHCPSCGAGFAMSEIKRVLTNRRKVGHTSVTNIDVTSKCRKCGFIATKPIIIEEDLAYS